RQQDAREVAVADELCIVQEAAMAALDNLGEHEPRNQTRAEECAVVFGLGDDAVRENRREYEKEHGDKARRLDDQPSDAQHRAEVTQLQVAAHAAPDETAIVPQALYHRWIAMSPGMARSSTSGRNRPTDGIRLRRVGPRLWRRERVNAVDRGCL